MLSRTLIVFTYVVFTVGCASQPKNTVGAAYDADSSYCRGLVEATAFEVPRDRQDSAPSNRDLYDQHCEPIGPWLARDLDGHDRTVAMERSLLGQLWDKIFR